MKRRRPQQPPQRTRLQAAKPGEGLSIERLREVLARPGGRAFLMQQREQVRDHRAEIERLYLDQLAQVDEVLRRYDLVLDGGIQA